MGTFTKISSTAFNEMQLDAGVLLNTFNPASPAVADNAIITATTGGITASCKPTYSDLGEDVDNCPNNTKELKHLDGWDCKMSFTALGTTPAAIKLALGAADIDGTNTSKIVPRADLAQTDFADLWWVGDKADGIAAINTINSITGVNIYTLVAEPSVQGKSIVGGYSGAAVKPIALRFISDMSRADELQDLHISGMGGIETWRDGLEFLLLGAGSVQVTTAVMQYGYRIIDELLEGLEEYMMCKGVASVNQLIGAASRTVVDHQSLERDKIVFPVFNYEKCNGCGRCYISCMDGGHQAIEFNTETRRPKLIGSKCVGCHLCRLVCAPAAIGKADKAIERK